MSHSKVQALQARVRQLEALLQKVDEVLRVYERTPHRIVMEFPNGRHPCICAKCLREMIRRGEQLL
jgi:hypothetical protein